MSIPSSNIITPPINFAYGGPEITVEIWPHNGGKFVFNGAQNGVLAARVEKNIREKDGGKFELELAPSGPNGGVTSDISWTSVLTPMSLVIISLARGGSARTVMMGVITSVDESQFWNNKEVVRTIRVTGMDFTYFFSSFSYYQLTYLAIVANQPALSVAGNLLGQAGKDVTGSPAKVSKYWFDFVMMGTDSTTSPTATACLQTTYVMYNGKQIFLHDLFSSWFEEFTEQNLAIIPLYEDLLNAEGSWMDKFLAFLPFPYYEFFVTTAESTDYSSASKATYPVTETGFPSVSPTLVARVNPLPWITYPPAGSSTAATLQTSRWNNLPTYSLGDFSFIQSEVDYDTNEVCNFLGITTLFTDQMAGKVGGSANLFGFEVMGGILDHASINNYGFRPNFSHLRWMTGPPSITAVTSGSFDITATSSVLLGKLASYYIPTPNMLSGKIMIPLWPDILPGNRFLYNPFKNTDVYEFYIEGVSHFYEFGGKSYTILDVSRGLKKSDYDDPKVMVGVHLDSYAPIDGVLSPRTDTNLNVPAFYFDPSLIGNLPAGATAYYSGPPTINSTTSATPTASGWPAGATSSFDDDFKTAAAACPGMDWRNLKAQAIAESSINQAALSSAGAVGIMQVLPSAHPEYDPTLLKTDPHYNIMAGGQIMCNLLDTYGSFDQALRHYISGNPDGASPANKAIIASYVATVNRYALAAGVPNTA